MEERQYRPYFTDTRLRSPASQALELFSIRSSESGYSWLLLNRDILKILTAAFQPNHQLVVVAVAGLCGSGKSTWLNALVSHLEPTVQVPPFYPQFSETKTTKGLWIYPKPLPLPGKRDTDLLLIDMEGMDGLEDDTHIPRPDRLLQRVLFLILMTSSCCCIHMRRDRDEAILREISQVATQLGQNSPDFFIYFQDTDVIPTNNIQNTLHLPDSFVSRLLFRARGCQTSAMSRRSRNTYKETIQSFISECSTHLKIRLERDQPITISGLTDCVSRLANFVNERNYIKRFIAHSIGAQNLAQVAQVHGPEHLEDWKVEIKDPEIRAERESYFRNFYRTSEKGHAKQLQERINKRVEEQRSKYSSDIVSQEMCIFMGLVLIAILIFARFESNKDSYTEVQITDNSPELSKPLETSGIVLTWLHYLRSQKVIQSYMSLIGTFMVPASWPVIVLGLLAIYAIALMVIYWCGKLMLRIVQVFLFGPKFLFSLFGRQF